MVIKLGSIGVGWEVEISLKRRCEDLREEDKFS
jgi:hypothetical protein